MKQSQFEKNGGYFIDGVKKIVKSVSKCKWRRIPVTVGEKTNRSIKCFLNRQTIYKPKRVWLDEKFVDKDGTVYHLEGTTKVERYITQLGTTWKTKRRTQQEILMRTAKRRTQKMKSKKIFESSVW